MRASLFIASVIAFVAVRASPAPDTTAVTTTVVSTTNTVTASPAPLVTDDPPAAHHIATFPQGGSQSVVGQCDAETPTNTTVGTFLTFNINGAPEDGGAFLYHIHEYPVPANGSCDATGGHLDPMNRGENPPCDASQPQTCEVGDLSGKHGDIPAIPGFTTSYFDNYISLNPDDQAFMGNRSLVIHYNNGTRLACANWVAVTNATNATNATTTTSATVTGMSTVGSAMTNAETASQTSATPSSTNSSKSGAAGLTAALTKTVVGFGPLVVIAAALMV